MNHVSKGDGYEMLDREYTEKETELAKEVYENSLKYNEEKTRKALEEKDKLISKQSQELFEDRQRIAELERRITMLEASNQDR